MKNKLIAAFLWFFGVVFIIRGLSLLGESFLGSIFMILAGILMLPPIQKKITEISPSIKGLWLGVVYFSYWVFQACSFKLQKKSFKENGTASPELSAREADRKHMLKSKENLLLSVKLTKAAEKERRDQEREARDRAIAMQVDAEIALKNFLKI